LSFAYTLISFHTWAGIGLAEYFDNANMTARVSALVALRSSAPPLRKSKISLNLLCNATSSRHRVKIHFKKFKNLKCKKCDCACIGTRRYAPRHLRSVNRKYPSICYATPPQVGIGNAHILSCVRKCDYNSFVVWPSVIVYATAKKIAVYASETDVRICINTLKCNSLCGE